MLAAGWLWWGPVLAVLAAAALRGALSVAGLPLGALCCVGAWDALVCSCACVCAWCSVLVGRVLVGWRRAALVSRRGAVCCLGC
jgi:hypothetical protein